MAPQPKARPVAVAEEAQEATTTKKPDYVSVLSLPKLRVPEDPEVNVVTRRLNQGFDKNNIWGELDVDGNLVGSHGKAEGGSPESKPAQPQTRSPSVEPPPTTTKATPWWRDEQTTFSPPIGQDIPTAIPTFPQTHGGQTLPSGTRELDTETLKNFLRTVMVWASWVHEDVGHAAASLIYDPVNTPMFVPEDGVGIPMVPLAAMTAVYRSFIFVERAKLLDTPPPFWFDHAWCKKYLLVFTSCTRNNGDKDCFTEFQDELKALSSDPSFANCEDGLYPCLDRVETSAST